MLNWIFLWVFSLIGLLYIYIKITKIMHAVPIYSQPISFIIIILHESGSFVIINEPIMIHFYYLNFMVHSDFLNVHLMSLFCPRHITYYPHVFLGSSWLWQFLKFPLSLMALRVFSSAGQVLCKMSSSWGWYDFPPSWIDLDYGFGRRTTEAKCHCHFILSRVPRIIKEPLSILTWSPGRGRVCCILHVELLYSLLLHCPCRKAGTIHIA